MKSRQPITKKVKVIDEIHGLKVTDPYRWLEEDGKEIQKWVKSQNAFTHSFLNYIPQRKLIKKRLEELFRIDTIGIPVPRGNRYFLQERKKSEDLGVLYVQEGLRGSPRVLIDPNKLTKNKTTILKRWVPSKDGKLLAYSLSEAANDQSSIRILDVDTGKNLRDIIPGEIYPHVSAWETNNEGFWYTRRYHKAPKNEKKLHEKLYFHKLGDDYRNDQLIFGEELAKEDHPWVSISEDGRYLLVTAFINSIGDRKTDLYLFDRKDPKGRFIPIVKGKDALFYGAIHRDSIFIMTNNNAPSWKVVKVRITEVENGVENWGIVIKESENIIEGFKLMKDKLFIEALENVHHTLKVYDLNGKFISDINLPDLGSIDSMIGEREGDEMFFGFSSFTIPRVIYRYDLRTNKYSEIKRIDVYFQSDLFKVKQVWYKSKDDTKVPMFLVFKRGLELNGNNPTIIYGYGGFNKSVTPKFNVSIIPFLESGGIYAVANIRGGGEFGEKWHRNGIRDKKQKSFDDFISAAEWLINNRHTSSERLASFGWSNGGLLTAAALTQRPELFKVVIIGAPVSDMIRYHKFFGGRNWIPDYGSAEDPKQFKYLIKYSPYHNIKGNTSYPSVLIVTADKDDRVHPMHAYKMAARLQEVNVSENPIILRVETKSGHGGASSVTRSIEQFTNIWSFVFWQLGVNKR